MFSVSLTSSCIILTTIQTNQLQHRHRPQVHITEMPARSLGQLLELGFGKFQTFTFHVLVRRVGQQLMEGDDISGDLKF